MSKEFDVVVVGGGPGGYTAAIRASQLGKRVAVVEKEHLGGVCLNWGCIPTKALLKASELYTAMSHASDFGFKVKGVDVDVKKLISRSRDIAGGLSSGVGFLMKKNKIEVIEGTAKFSSKNTLDVTDKKGKTSSVTFTNAIVATGARARQIPGVLEADGMTVWTAKEAMVPEKLPKSLLVIGAGAIGVEFASFYNALGTKVTIVEAQNRITPAEDAEISKSLEKSLKKQGIEILTETMTKSLKVSKKDAEAALDVKGNVKKQKFEKVLLAIGVQANTEGLGLEDVGVGMNERGDITVDKFYRTTQNGIYAIGDVVGAPWLAHVASHEGVIAAEHISGQNHVHTMDYTNIPGCTYCTPQIGSVGFTEEKAKEEGYKVKVGRYNYQANGKALAIGEAEGLVKTIFDEETGELLGAHIIGAEATEMISTFVIGRHLETTEEEFVAACLPHPTLSEMLGESVLDSMGRALNA